MPPRARLRPYVPSDREACFRIFDSNIPPFFRDAERPGFADFLEDLPGPYFVLLDSDGSVAMSVDRDGCAPGLDRVRRVRDVVGGSA